MISIKLRLMRFRSFCFATSTKYIPIISPQHSYLSPIEGSTSTIIFISFIADLGFHSAPLLPLPIRRSYFSDDMLSSVAITGAMATISTVIGPA